MTTYKLTLKDYFMPGYAVVDTETTGFAYSKSDRIIEVAIVLIDASGQHIEGEWTSLINPGRYVGNKGIHGIKGADLTSAPRFSEVAGDIAHLLKDRVFVAHNAPFDRAFINAEFERAGHFFPVTKEASFCTMQYGKKLIDAPNHKLTTCCAAFGITLKNAHEALADTRATAELFMAYIKHSPHLPLWDSLQVEAESLSWYSMPQPTRRFVHRGNGVRKAAASTIQREVISKLPYRAPSPISRVDEEAYLDHLYWVLIDGVLPLREMKALANKAKQLGLDQRTAQRLHIEYLEYAAQLRVNADNYIRLSRRMEINKLAELLNVPFPVKEAIKRDANKGILTAWTPSHVLSAGDRVAFTGDGGQRTDLEEMAQSKGLIASPSLTRTAVMLFADDVDSLSSKARKADEWGVPIVSFEHAKRVLRWVRQP